MQVIENSRANVSFSSSLKRYTLEEFRALPEPDDRSHHELIEGLPHIVLPSTSEHEERTSADAVFAK
jgi:Uma2 family endonuclease